MEIRETLDQDYINYEYDKEYLFINTVDNLTEDILHIMKDKHISRVELAKKLGNKPSYITKLLNGANLTISKMIDIGLALNCKLKIEYKPIIEFDKSKIVYPRKIYPNNITKKTFDQMSQSYSISQSKPLAYNLTLE